MAGLINEIGPLSNRREMAGIGTREGRGWIDTVCIEIAVTSVQRELIQREKVRGKITRWPRNGVYITAINFLHNARLNLLVRGVH